MSLLLAFALLSADLHADGYAINVAPKGGKVCVVVPEGRQDGDCEGLDLTKLRARKVEGLAIVRHESASYELAIERMVEKDIGATSQEELDARGEHTIVSIAGSPAARFSSSDRIVYEVPSDDRALLFTFSGGAATMSAEAESMVHSIVRPRADLTLYGKPRSEQDAFRAKYASVYRKTHLAVRIASWLAVLGVVVLGARIWKRRKRA